MKKAILVIGLCGLAMVGFGQEKKKNNQPKGDPNRVYNIPFSDQGGGIVVKAVDSATRLVSQSDMRAKDATYVENVLNSIRQLFVDSYKKQQADTTKKNK